MNKALALVIHASISFVVLCLSIELIATFSIGLVVIGVIFVVLSIISFILLIEHIDNGIYSMWEDIDDIDDKPKDE